MDSIPFMGMPFNPSLPCVDMSYPVIMPGPPPLEQEGLCIGMPEPTKDSFELSTPATSCPASPCTEVSTPTSSCLSSPCAEVKAKPRWADIFDDDGDENEGEVAFFAQ